MLCFGPRALWFLQGSIRVLAVLSHMPVRAPQRWPWQGQRRSCSVDTWVDRWLLDIFAVWGKWILILGLFGFLKYCFPSAFLISIDKFCKKKKKNCVSYWMSVPLATGISCQCSAGLEMMPPCQGEGGLGSVLEAGLRGFALRCCSLNSHLTVCLPGQRWSGSAVSPHSRQAAAFLTEQKQPGK